jgi:hypothetical protein
MAKEAKTMPSSPSRRMKIGDFLLDRRTFVGLAAPSPLLKAAGSTTAGGTP